MVLAYNDRLYDRLGDLGFTGSLSDRMSAFLDDDDVNAVASHIVCIPYIVPPKASSGPVSTDAASALYYLGVQTWVTSQANNEWMEYDFEVDAGTYKLRVVWGRTTVAGICTVSIDGVDLAGNIDMYGASAHNQITDKTGIVLTRGRHTVRYRANGKNASSTGFGIFLQGGVILTRTGA